MARNVVSVGCNCLFFLTLSTLFARLTATTCYGYGFALETAALHSARHPGRKGCHDVQS